MLHRLRMRFAGREDMYELIASRLTTKTVKQIRDKCSYIKKRARLQEQRDQDSSDSQSEELTSPIESDVEENRQAGASAESTNVVSDVPQIMDFDLKSEQSNFVTQHMDGLRALLAAIPEYLRTHQVVAELSQAIESIIRGKNEMNVNRMSLLYESLLGAVKPPVPHNSQERRTRSTVRKNQKKSVKKYIYARSQEIFKKSPSLLAKYVIDNISFHTDNQLQISKEDIRGTYENLWGKTVKSENLEIYNYNQDTERTVGLRIIGMVEVDARLKRTKDGAKGRDGIGKDELKKPISKILLCLFFNLVIFSGIFPNQWGNNRTTLLLKKGKDPKEVRSYRPVTISSMIERIFWGLVDQQLRSQISLFCRQKGFVKENGCYANIHILNELITRAKRNHCNLITVFLDLSQAFDLVPHDVIAPALRKKGFQETVIHLISSSYENQRTSIHTGTGTVDINVKRGVKQGDPLSPLIFNLVLEPLLVKLAEREGCIVGNESVSCMAFADDLTVVADSHEKAEGMVHDIEKFLDGIGMIISTPKSRCFQIAPTKDSFCMKDPLIKRLNNEFIPALEADEGFNYLGAKIYPWSNKLIPSLKNELSTVLKRVKKLSLKPHQKVNLISSYILPHYLYTLITLPANVTLLRELDRTVRVIIKDILHQEQSRADASLYAPTKDGGLAIPRLEWIATAAALKNGINFLNSEDPLVRELKIATNLENRLKGIANAVRINWPCNVKEVEKHKQIWKNRNLEEWKGMKFQGKAVESFKGDSIGNHWLKNPTLLRPGRYITALRMRTNQVGLRVPMNIARPQVNINCRKCNSQPETLGHVIGLCTYTKPARIRRHNEILDFIIDDIAKGNKEVELSKEPTISVESRIYKPDLIIKSKERILVVDITVRLEDGRYLDSARLEKINKYSPLLHHLLLANNISHGQVIPVVIGSRGGMPKNTIIQLRKLGITGFNKLLTLSLIALRTSIEIYHSFVDYDGAIQ